MRGTRGATRSRGQRLLYPPPSLDLRFAETKSLTDWISGQNLITFTRVSSATTIDSTGALETVAAGSPRFTHDPLTGESLGLLVEESRTNLLLRSEEFDNASWNKNLCSVSANNAISPAGTNSADLIVPTAVNGAHQLYTAVNTIASTAYTFSFYVKASGYSRFQFGPGNAGVGGLDRVASINLGLLNPIVSQDPIFNNSVSVTPVGSGWFRVLATFTTTAGGFTTIAPFQLIFDNSGALSYAGDGTSGIYIWGAQLEAGAFPTSYIPTTTATATRSADVASITGASFSSWYRQDEGTILAEGSVVQPVTAGNQFFFRTSDNGYSNSIALNIQSTGFLSLATSAAGVFDGNASSIVSLPANTAAKLIGAYAANNLGVSLNGATVATDLSATIPTTLNRLDIGSDHLGFNRVGAGIIRRLTYWPQRLPNNTLIALTR